jgi:four helix bundle protein
MASITRFEDLIVWQKASSLCLEIYSHSARGRFGDDFSFRNQIRRAALSISSNVAEGFERYSRTEFRHFLAIARGSAAEVRSQLFIARHLGYVTQPEYVRLNGLCLEITRMLARLHACTRNPN